MVKRTQIVCQHLENVSRAALEEFQDLLRPHLRGRHGIYALYRNGRLHYVGLASNLRARLKQHLHDRHKTHWDRFSVYLTIDNRAIKELETLLLRIVDPVGNRAAGRFVNSQNLAPALRRQIRTLHSEKLRELAPQRRMRSLTRKLPGKDAPAGRQPPLARFVHARVPLRARTRGKRYLAVVRSDGRVRYDGIVYESPSAAASAVRNKPTNGWAFWKYERAPGDWVPLTKLRQ